MTPAEEVPPLSEQLNSRAKELGLVTGTMDDQAISRFVASVIVALVSGPLGPSIQLATSEKTLREVQSIHSEQEKGFIDVLNQLQELGLGVQDLRNLIPALGSAQRTYVVTMVDGVRRTIRLNAVGSCVARLADSKS